MPHAQDALHDANDQSSEIGVTDDASADDGSSDGAVAIVCMQCLTPNPESRHFCLQCATPLTSHAAIDPLGRIYATADTYRKAIARPTKPVILIGMWLIFGPNALSALGMAFSILNSIYEENRPMQPAELLLHSVPVLFLAYGAIAVIILVRLTRNFVDARGGIVKSSSGGFEVITPAAGAPLPDQPDPLMESGSAEWSLPEHALATEDQDSESLDALLLSDEDLGPLDEHLRELIEAQRFPFPGDPNDKSYGLALRNYLLFAQWPYLVHELDVELDEDAVFYNAYYRFCLYAKLRHLDSGPDSFESQHRAEMFTRAGASIQQAVLEQIDARVDEEMAVV